MVNRAESLAEWKVTGGKCCSWVYHNKSNRALSQCDSLKVTKKRKLRFIHLPGLFLWSLVSMLCSESGAFH